MSVGTAQRTCSVTPGGSMAWSGTAVQCIGMQKNVNEHMHASYFYIPREWTFTWVGQGCSSKEFKLNPKGDQIGRGLGFDSPHP